jgi:hypothetical protein
MRRLRLAAISTLCLFVTAASAFGTAKMQVTSVAAKTTTGTQDITISGFGTPVAAIFVMSRGVTTATPADNSNLSIGFTDGTTDQAVTSNDEHGQATSDSTRNEGAYVVFMNTEGTATTLAAATFSSWTTDGVTINWSTVTGNGERLMVVFFGGTDMSAKVGSTTINTAGTPIDETGVGFQPDVVLGAWIHDTGAGTDHQISFGCGWDNSGTVWNRSWAQHQPDANAKGNPELLFSDSFAGSDEAFGTRITLNTYDSSGFNVLPTVADADSHKFHWLALKNAGAEAWYLATYTNPTASGTDAVTAPGFKPQCVLFGISHARAVDSVEADADSASVGVGAMDGTREEAIVVTSEDNVNDTNTQSLYTVAAMEIRLETGANDDTALFSSFDANGFTLNWVSGPALARKHWYLALQEEQADAGAGQPFHRRGEFVPGMHGRQPGGIR